MWLSVKRILFNLFCVFLALAQFPMIVEAQIADASSNKTAKTLSEKEDPRLVGKRNINKGSINFYSLEKEVALGRQIAAEIDKQAKFVDDPLITEYINRLGQNIVLNSDSKVAFTIKVIDSDDVNAFALPGGFFYINKGLILTADNEAEIVGVMAHEIAHVAARHGMEQASKGQLAQILSIPLVILGGGVLGREAARIGLPIAFTKFSRDAEKEADMFGAEYTWVSGYDPYALITFFEKLEKKHPKKPNIIAKIYASHPPTQDRIEKVRDLLVRFPDRDEYIIDSSEFKIIKTHLLRITNTRYVDRTSQRDTEPKKPTLKRRSDKDNPDPDAEEKPKEKPTLKRRDSDGREADKKPPQI